MKNPIWNNSVIFLAWDDWGSLYDHVRPPMDPKSKTTLMYGPRVPGIAISPYIAQGAPNTTSAPVPGYIDHQQLSFDSYLRFIEDLFLDGTRITGDQRPMQRETATGLGDLLYEFDFNRAPISTTAAGAQGTAIMSLNCSNTP
jgi:phospholipase C